MSCLQSDHVLDAVEAHFRSSSVASKTVVDGASIGHGLPQRPLPVMEVRDLLLDRNTEAVAKDAVWRELVQLARSHQGDWQLAALWMMNPGLRKISARWSRSACTDAKEIESEAVLGLIEALQQVDPDREGLGAALWWKVYGHVAQVAARQRREFPVEDVELLVGGAAVGAVPEDPLGDAVHNGVLTGQEADLISRTRLEGERLGSVAQRMGLRYHACRQRRARAEGRLAGYLLIEGSDNVPRPPAGRACKRGPLAGESGAA